MNIAFSPQITLVQSSKLLSAKKLHYSKFERALKKSNIEVLLFEKTNPVSYLKSPISLYNDPRSSFAVINTFKVNPKVVKEFVEKQLGAATKINLEGKVCYPRTIFFSAVDPSIKQELKGQAWLELFFDEYKDILSAGIAELAISETEAIEKIVKLLTRKTDPFKLTKQSASSISVDKA